MTVYLYDFAGAWIAFRTDFDGRYLFDPLGEWLGWFPFSNDESAVTRNGTYLGTVVENRLLWRTVQPYRTDPGYPGAPAFPGRASYPGAVGYFGAMSGFEDVPKHLLLPDDTTHTGFTPIFGT